MKRPVILLLLAVPCLNAASIFQKIKPKPVEPSPLDKYLSTISADEVKPPEAQPGSLWTPHSHLTNAARDMRASAPGDLITVIVSETTNAVVTGATTSQRTSSANASVNSLAGPKAATGALANLANLSGAQKLDGKGTTTRTTSLSSTLTAHVANWTDGTATISVLDNETTVLALAIPASVTEGGTGIGTVSISGTMTTALAVALSSNNTARLTVPASVTIPAGSTSATFTLTAPDNTLRDGSAPATVAATAAGFTGASATTSVLDNDVEHFTVSAIAASQIRGLPFSITLVAKDINNATIASYAGTAGLSAGGAES